MSSPQDPKSEVLTHFGVTQPSFPGEIQIKPPNKLKLFHVFYHCHVIEKFSTHVFYHAHVGIRSFRILPLKNKQTNEQLSWATVQKPDCPQLFLYSSIAFSMVTTGAAITTARVKTDPLLKNGSPFCLWTCLWHISFRCNHVICGLLGTGFFLWIGLQGLSMLQHVSVLHPSLSH